MLTTQNTKLWLPFEGNANDASGNGLNGTANNITYAAGAMEKCAVFDGSTSYVSCPNIAMSTNMSFVVDFQLSTTNTQYILSKRTSISNGFLLFFWSNGSGLNLDFGGYRFSTNYIPALNTRTQVIFTRTASKIVLYVNGLFANYSSIGGYLYDNTSNVLVGKDALNTSGFFNGKINFIQIYNAFINEDNALRIYNGLHPIF